MPPCLSALWIYRSTIFLRLLAMLSKNLSLFIGGILVGVLATTVAFSLAIRGTSRSEGKVLRLGHGLDQSHPVHKAMEYMAELVAERSGGELRIVISPNGQLGSEVECLELVQRGAIPMCKSSTAALEAFVPEVAVFGIPYLFDGEDHCWRVLESDVGRELLAVGEPKGLKGLCYFDAGARSFYTIDRPIETPADLAGLKIRTQESATAMRMVEALGGSPTPLNFGELYSALQQGLVDGAENNPPSFYTDRHFEVCKQYSLDEHTRVPDVLLINTDAWNALTPAEQRIVAEAAAESSLRQRELWRERTEQALAEVQKRGVNVSRPNQRLFSAKVIPLQEEMAAGGLGPWVDRIKAMGTTAP
jgi:tripartite ATP-independent transporter DctP family solute receptor